MYDPFEPEFHGPWHTGSKQDSIEIPISLIHTDTSIMQFGRCSLRDSAMLGVECGVASELLYEGPYNFRSLVP